MKSLLTWKWYAAGCLAVALLTTAAAGQDGPRLDHVFVIVMENHAYGQIVGNPNAPFITHTPTPLIPRATISPSRIRV